MAARSSTGNGCKDKEPQPGPSRHPPPSLLANVWCTKSYAVNCTTRQPKATVPRAAASARGHQSRQPRHHEQGQRRAHHTAAPCARGNPRHCQVESRLSPFLPFGVWGLPSVPPGSRTRHLGTKTPSAHRGSVARTHHPRGPRGYHRPYFLILTALPVPVLQPSRPQP